MKANHRPQSLFSLPRSLVPASRLTAMAPPKTFYRLHRISRAKLRLYWEPYLGCMPRAESPQATDTWLCHTLWTQHVSQHVDATNSLMCRPPQADYAKTSSGLILGSSGSSTNDRRSCCYIVSIGPRLELWCPSFAYLSVIIQT